MMTSRMTVALSSLSYGARTSSHRPGRLWSEMHRIACNRCCGIVELGGMAVDHHGPIVHRRLEHRASDDESVDERHADADRPARRRRRDARFLRAVEEQPITVAPVDHRDDHRPVAVDERNVGDQSAIEDIPHGRAVVRRAMSRLSHAIEIGDLEGLCHEG